MIKVHKFFILGLISCMSFKIYSNIGQLVKGIRQSDISIVESEIEANKITKEEAKGLLDIAKEVEDLKKTRMGKSPRMQKLLIKIWKELRLLLVGGVALGTGTFSGIAANVVFSNGSGDKKIAKTLCPILGLISILSGGYAFYLFKKMKKFKAKQDQYFDSMAIRQILERLASAQ